MLRWWYVFQYGELKKLTELQVLNLFGTALTGLLSPNFCMGDFNIINFEADCSGDQA
jgi:hypothetical protein